MKRDYYDIHWQRLDLVKERYKSDVVYEKPKNLNDIIRISRDLSKNFSFVRVDFYYENNRIYFGELTLTPASGINMTYTDNALFELGRLLTL